MDEVVVKYHIGDFAMDEGKKTYETFEELYLNTHRLVFMFIRDYTKDWDTAEEISSIVWLKIWERPETYFHQEISWVHNYIRVMVKNEVCEQYRIKTRQDKKLEKIAEISKPSLTAEEEFILKENLNELKKARKQLSEAEKQLLDLRFDQGLTVKETGRVMGLTQSTVKMRQCRLLMKLRKMME